MVSTITSSASPRGTSAGRRCATRRGPLSAETVLAELRAQGIVARVAAIGVKDAVRDAINLGGVGTTSGPPLASPARLLTSASLLWSAALDPEED